MDRKVVPKFIQHPKLVVPEIWEAVGALAVSNRTVQRCLKDVELHGRKSAKKPFLKLQHVKGQLELPDITLSRISMIG